MAADPLGASDPWAKLRRPLHQLRLAAGSACPVSGIDERVDWSRARFPGSPGIGRGPVSPGLGYTAGVLTATPDTQYGGPWAGQKVFWYVLPSYRGLPLRPGRASKRHARGGVRQANRPLYLGEKVRCFGARVREVASSSSEPASDVEPSPERRQWHEGALRLSLPVLTTVVSAVLVANFVTSRQDIHSQQHQRDLQTKALIANDISSLSVKAVTAAQQHVVRTWLRRRSAPIDTRQLLFGSDAGFTAQSLLIRAKLLAYYSDPTIAVDWRNYSRAVAEYIRLGLLTPGADLRKAFVGDIHHYLGSTSNPVMADFYWRVLASPGGNSLYVDAYQALGDVLIDRVARVIREALTGKRELR